MPVSIAAVARAAGLDPSRCTYLGKPLEECEPEQPRAKLPPKRRDLADAFAALWEKFGPPIPLVREYRFHPTRRWRFDAAFLEHKIAVEMEGGIWTRGRHTRGRGYRRDLEKYNAATELGWRVFRFCANDLEYEPQVLLSTLTGLLTKTPAAAAQ